MVTALSALPAPQFEMSEAPQERQSGKSVASSVSNESAKPDQPHPLAELAVAARPVVPAVVAGSVSQSDKKPACEKLRATDQEVLTSLSVIAEGLQHLPELLAKREEVARADLHGTMAEQVSGVLARGPLEAGWQDYPLPDRLTDKVEAHLHSGHAEAGTHRGETLSGNEYRLYLWSLSERELQIELAATAWSSLAKSRQLEHDMHFLEDRTRKMAALPAEIVRTHQQATSDLQAAEESADLAQQNTAKTEWARERSDWLNVQLRGICLAGLWALCWAGCHWQPRSR